MRGTDGGLLARWRLSAKADLPKTRLLRDVDGVADASVRNGDTSLN